MLPSPVLAIANRAFRPYGRSFTCALVALLGLGACDAGATGTQSPPTASPQAEGEFSLLFRDDFEALDSTRWQLMTHSWDSNLALFSPTTATIEDGALVLRLLPAPSGTADSGNPKSFLGAEVRSKDTLTYGRVRARVKFARGSAVISSLVTIYTPWPADDWNELDIESLGATPTSVQFNAQVYLGPPTTPPVTTPVSPTPEEMKVALGFDASADYHIYEIEWTPAGARFSVDGAAVRTWNTHIDRMKLPQNVLLTIWASSSSGWAGPVTEETGKAAASYDWVELYQYTP